MKPEKGINGSVWPFLLALVFVTLLFLIGQLIRVKPVAARAGDERLDSIVGMMDSGRADQAESKNQNHAPLAGIVVAKDAEPSVVHYGNPVTYTFTVNNLAGEPVTDLFVSDNLCSPVIFQGGDTNNNNRLDVGENWVYVCTRSLTKSTLNLVYVSGVRLSGGAVSDTDTAYVNVIRPELTVIKNPEQQTVEAGSPVTFTIHIQNTGDVDLINVVATDPLTPACDRVIGNMPVGSIVNYSCVLDEVNVGFTNLITVTGTPPSGPQINQYGSSVIDVTLDGLMISKVPESEIILYDSSASFSIAITNSTPVDLVDVRIIDPLVPDCDRVVGDLASNDSLSFTCGLDNVIKDMENVATVYASTPHGLTLAISDTASLNVITPSITITRTPTYQYILSGDTAAFEIAVINSGDSLLSDVVVNDILAADCSRSIGVMEPADVVTFHCSLINILADQTLMAVAGGKSLAGTDVISSVVTVVDVISPMIEIVKMPDFQNVPFGQTAAFTMEITNRGDALLENVSVVDALSPDCDRTIGAMAAGEIVTFTCKLEGVESDFTNLAVVSGTPPAGPIIAASDEGQVNVLHPGIVVVKRVDPDLVAPGSPITFTLQITNTGDLPIRSVVMTDTLPAGLSYLAGRADPVEPDIVSGETIVWSSLGPVQSGDTVKISFQAIAEPMLDGIFSNQVHVRGETDGGIVLADDTVPVSIQAPTLEIDKRVTGADVGVFSSNLVTFTIAITNTGISVISVLPLEDNYDPDVLSILRAVPGPASMINDGNLEWSDLTGLAPDGFGKDLEPDESFRIIVVFNVTHRINVTTNNAAVNGAFDEFGNPLAEIFDSETLVDVPTAVELSSFRSYRENGRIVLDWETAWEWNNWGFHIHRSDTSRLSEAGKIAFVLGQGWGQAGGHVYRYIDTTAIPGESYTYWLEDEDLQGSRWITAGPVMVAGLSNWLYLPVVLR